VSGPAELALAQRWREEATLLRRRAAEVQAEVMESCAADLETWARERDLEGLTLDEAVAESGYSYSSLQKRVQAGELQNIGRKGAPRVRRGDLPHKAAPKPTGNGIADLVLPGRSAAAGRIRSSAA
jgi:hypothetical protein